MLGAELDIPSEVYEKAWKTFNILTWNANSLKEELAGLIYPSGISSNIVDAQVSPKT